jgi:hypothetical protein
VSRYVKAAAIGCLLVAIAGCDPSDRRPGFWLTGDTFPFPEDWSFTDQIPEIAIQVHAPYLLPHSVTIWCSSVDSRLYVGASAPETKRWPGWTDRNPNVKLKIDGKVYEARLVPLEAAEAIAPVQRAFATKYKLPASPQPGTPSARLWAVEAAAG